LLPGRLKRAPFDEKQRRAFRLRALFTD